MLLSIRYCVIVLYFIYRVLLHCFAPLLAEIGGTTLSLEHVLRCDKSLTLEAGTVSLETTYNSQ